MKRLSFLTRGYTKKSLYQLFMLCAFPIHVWAFLMAFRDFGWVAERTNVWDALGLLSYAMAFAMLESIGVFLIVVLLGLLVPSEWGADKRLALLGILFLIVCLWAILGQMYSIAGYPVPKWVVNFLVWTEHPLRMLWGGAFLLAVVSAALPALWILKREKAKGMIIDMFDRISLLSAIYVFFDLVGIIIIAIRNLRV